MVHSHSAIANDQKLHFASLPGLKQNSFALINVFLFAGASFLLGAPTTLTPVADTMLSENWPSNNQGGLTFANSGTTQNFTKNRALYRFDIAGAIPSHSKITSATLVLEVTKQPADGYNFADFGLHRMLQDWGEGNKITRPNGRDGEGSLATTGESTWYYRFAFTKAWASPGGAAEIDFTANASAVQTVYGTGDSPYSFGSTAQTVADVQFWLENPQANFGWALVCNSEDTDFTARRFASREDVNFPPHLVVDYVALLEILTQPQSQSVAAGSTAAFSVTASGQPPLTYQWQLNGVPISGATNDTLVLDNVQTNNAGDYVVTVTDASGSTNSAPATLMVSPLLPGIPLVNIVTPTNGTKFPAHSDVLIVAEASITNGTITQVEFFLGTNSIGVVTNETFSIVASNFPAGNYTLTARATEQRGGTNTSAAVIFTVYEPPTVRITQPADGSRFALGTNVTLEATVRTAGQRVSKVEFFDGAARIVTLTNAPYRFNWTPTEARSHTLTAAATDELGQTASSAPVTIHIFQPESNPPSIAITNSPANFARLKLPSLLLEGKAADDIGLDRVQFRINDGAFETAIGTNRWQIRTNLQPGLNIVRVRSVDLAGNTSLEATRFFTYVVTSPLTVTNVGHGTITPDLNHHELEIGQTYTLTARPDLDSIFAHWNLTSNSPSAVLNFTMQSNLVLIANFVSNAFPEVQGIYTGLFLDTNNVLPESSGFFNLRVGSKGAFSGKLIADRKNYPLHGQFDHLGQASLAILRRGTEPLALKLTLDLTNGTGKVSGTVMTAEWIADLLGNRNVFDMKSNPAPLAGDYSFGLVIATNDAGVGTGTAKIAENGSARLHGVFAENRRFNFGSALSKNGDVPFYFSFTHEMDAVIGWLNFSNSPALAGNLFWAKDGTNGFSIQLNAVPIP